VAKKEHNDISVRSMNTDDRRPTSHYWKISFVPHRRWWLAVILKFLTAIVSATRHPIHFMYVRPLYFALRQFTSLLTVLENWRYFARDGTYTGYPGYLWHEEKEVKTVTILFKVA